ncbi:putative disease resistance RPP13-like protein 1 [Vitis vinifera]|uniref:Putative disease resistance RPP13-like protein 1 n=1 Tax=Vitis vinifera TaxID=29760 RepID=A0A438GPT3_VITVI|nr:putative disease resistance RPP13-like protein 1 [Vitis vinifera]
MGKLINLRHLDISDTSLKEMPMGMKGLKRLQTLTAFVVGEDRGAKIKELRDMSHLGGRLCISKLQNVVDAMDVFEANLKGKERLDELVMQWDGEATARDLQKETTVLEKLQPHNNLKELTIEHYCGEKFPNWLGEHSFTNMVSMQLHDCKNCSSLPSLGQLGSLKELSIMRIDGVQKVGQEFYGNIGSSSFKPFEALEILRFEKILEWEEWVCREIEFPCLKELYIKICPKLKKDLPKHLPKLTKLEISKCGQLVCRLPMAPFINELVLEECDDVVSRSGVHLASLTSLNVSNICKIPVELQYLHSLEWLVLSDCPDLNELPPVLHKLTSLKRLEIKGCPRLSSVSEVELPSMLEFLRVQQCDSLESLPEGLMANNTRLQDLSIMHCGSLRSLPSCISSLESLFILGCGKLELPLPQDMVHNFYPSLTRLSIIGIDCESLTSFPIGLFTKLMYLDIMSCTNLESLSIPEELRHVDLTSLKHISIRHCPNLESFPQGGLPTPNLERLSILNCEKLKSLPPQMRTLLTSLEDLSIIICPEIDSFPEGGLPTSLSQLKISSCCKLEQGRVRWNLQTLPFLRKIIIGVDEEERLESFPEKWLLPPTLTTLTIWGRENLKSLDNKGLQHLTSLETLKLRFCYKLKHFPKQGLPSSLSCLKICECPLLKKRCQRDTGEEWPKISHISRIVFEEFDEGSFRPLDVIL